MMASHEWRRRAKCRACGSDNDMMSNLNAGDSTAPAAGSVVICLSCGLVSVMGDNGRLRKPTHVEQVGINHDRELQLALRAQREIKLKRAN